MATKRAEAELLPWLRTLFIGDGGRFTDGELLKRFLADHDDLAFAALVKRYGSMVLGVCRRILGNAADADDAFQATFLVLVRKARWLKRRRVVGDWLHGVARRTALKAKSAAARRKVVEKVAARVDEPAADARNDWLPRLDQELAKLPQKYRLPIVLCDLEGKTRQQAAQRLGWPEGTVAGRLARGRELLAKRLLRGAQMVAGVATGSMISSAAAGGLPRVLLCSTIQAASALAAGHGAAGGLASATAITLSKGVVHAMFWSKVKTAAVVLVAGGLLAGASGRTYVMMAEVVQENVSGSVHRSAGFANAAQDAQAPFHTGQYNKAQKEDKKAELKAAKDKWDKVWSDFLTDKLNPEEPDPLGRASRALLWWELSLAEKKADTISAQKGFLDRAEEVFKVALAKHKAGAMDDFDLNAFRRDFEAAKLGLVLAETALDQPSGGALVKAAQVQWEARKTEFLGGRTTVDFAIAAADMLLKADLRLADNKGAVIAAHQAQVDRMLELEKVSKAKFDSGQIQITLYAQTTYHRIEAEIILEEAKRGK